MEARASRGAVPLVTTLAAAAAALTWFALAFLGLPVRYVSMLGGDAVPDPGAVQCPALSGPTVDAARSLAVGPVLLLVAGSLAAVVLAARGGATPRATCAGVIATVLGAGSTFGAATLDPCVDLALRAIAPIVLVLVLATAPLLAREPVARSARPLPFPLVHAVAVALLVPSAAAWVTPETHQVFVCM